MSEPTRFTALVMAGSRAAGDPLALASGVGDKAFVRVAGVPMLVRVLSALRAARHVGRIVVLGLDPHDAQREILGPAGADPRLGLVWAVGLGQGLGARGSSLILGRPHKSHSVPGRYARR